MKIVDKFVNTILYYYNFICLKINYILEFLYSKVYNYNGFSFFSKKIKDYDLKFLKEEKYEFSNYNLLNKVNKNYIIKQNKALTKDEFLSYAISNGSNRSYFYSPLHSFLPLFISGVVFSILIILIALFFRDISIENKSIILFIFIFSLALSLSFWFSKFYLEKKMGKHIDFIRHNIVLGFYLFIMTEGLCFLALFWTFLHSTLAASIHIGVFNPGEGVVNFYISESYRISKNWNIYNYNTFGSSNFYNLSSLFFITDIELFKHAKVKTHINVFDSGSLINPWKLPFINTLILLSSAASLNASHCYMLLSRYFSCLLALFITIIFGILFVFMQFKEYKSCSLNYNDGIYPSCFFGITGLHGIHVILGIIALIVCLFNIYLKNFSPNFHQTFYFSIFYWHFVDIIWIAVWLIIYLWPGSYFFTDQYLSCYSENLFVYNMNTDFLLNLLDYNAWEIFYSTDNLFYIEIIGDKKPIHQCIDDSFKSLDNLIYIHDSFTHEKSIYTNYNIYDSNKSFYLEDCYGIFLDNNNLFNFNLIKKNVLYYCIFMTEIHSEVSSCVYCPIFNDVQNKYFRFSIYLFMNMILPKVFVYIYLNFFFSPWYFYNVF